MNTAPDPLEREQDAHALTRVKLDVCRGDLGRLRRENAKLIQQLDDYRTMEFDREKAKP